MNNVSLKSMLVGAAVAYSAVAIPLAPHIRRDDDERWKNEEGGNTEISVDDRRIDWGDISPSQVLGEIKDSCTRQGCSKGQEIKKNGAWEDKDGVQTGELTINVNGVFDPDSDAGNIDTLIDIAIEFFKETTDNEEYTVDTAAAGSMYSGQMQSGGDDDKKTYKMYNGPEVVHISVRDDDRDLNSWLHISIETEMASPGGDLCDTLTTVGSAIAGNINGVVSGVATLAGLFCGAEEGE